MTIAKVWTTLAICESISESNARQRKDSMKMPLSKLKASESNNHKHENNTCKRKGTHKWQFAELTEIEVQTQLECEKWSLSMCSDC